jgi:hypothetical protein
MNDNLTLADTISVSDICQKTYDNEEIKHWNLQESYAANPLAKKPVSLQSKYAYQAIMKGKSTKKYLLPGEICLFTYSSPKYGPELDYYDATPMVLFFGITRIEDGSIREIGFNLHYYPPFARIRILDTIYNIFKDYYKKYFNKPGHSPNGHINYNLLKRMFRNQKIAFGLRMYIPVLRGETWVIPTKLLPTAAYTEGHFSGATLTNIKSFWRRFHS